MWWYLHQGSRFVITQPRPKWTMTFGGSSSQLIAPDMMSLITMTPRTHPLKPIPILRHRFFKISFKTISPLVKHESIFTTFSCQQRYKTKTDLLANQDRPVADANLVSYTVNGHSRRRGSGHAHPSSKTVVIMDWDSSILLGEEPRLTSSRRNESSHHDSSPSFTILYTGQSFENRRNNRQNDRASPGTYSYSLQLRYVNVIFNDYEI